ncbi:MAG TPA: fused MFS/spermidine synthase [Alphaproteobacteria bacterium]
MPDSSKPSETSPQLLSSRRVGARRNGHSRRRSAMVPANVVIQKAGTIADVAMVTIVRKPTRYGDILVVRSRADGSYTYLQGGYCQSEVDGDGISLSSYIHAIYGLLTQTNARHILMIGCGGGTLATMLARAGRSVTVVDVNPTSFQIAREHFFLSAEIVCHVRDGQRFLEQDDGRYDAIVVDAFIGDIIPPHLRSVQFFRSAQQKLTAYGCIVSNVMLRDDLDARARLIAANMAEAGLHACLLDAPGKPHRNAIVMGGPVLGVVPPRLLVKPDVGCDEIIEDLARLRFRPWRSRVVEPHGSSLSTSS